MDPTPFTVASSCPLTCTSMVPAPLTETLASPARNFASSRVPAPSSRASSAPTSPLARRVPAPPSTSARRVPAMFSIVTAAPPSMTTESIAGMSICSRRAGRWNHRPFECSTISRPFSTFVTTSGRASASAVSVTDCDLPTVMRASPFPRNSMAWKASTLRTSERVGPLGGPEHAASSKAPSAAGQKLRKRVVDILHVLVLFQLVQQRHHFDRLVFRHSRRRAADVFMSSGQRRDATVLQRFLQVAEFVEGAADDQLRFAFFAGAFAHLVQAVVDEVQLQVVVIDAGRV